MEESTRPNPIFVDGMMFKLPHPNSPEFVKGSISIKVDNLIEFLRKHEDNGWVNCDMKKSREGKIYFQLNTWKPTATKGETESLGKGKKADEINTDIL